MGERKMNTLVNQIPTYEIRDAVNCLTTGRLSDGSVFFVVFDDGVTIKTHNRYLLYNMAYFQFHAMFPRLPYLSRHYAQVILKGKQLSTSTSADVLTNISRDVCEIYDMKSSVEYRQLMLACMKVINLDYNTMAVHTVASVYSITIYDLLELINHPTMKKIFWDVSNGKISIKQAYNLCGAFLREDPSVANNNAAIGVRCRMLNENQLMQTVMVRGYPTEVNGDIMPHPVMTNFVKGLYILYDFVAESRSAAKSYYYSEAPIQDAEYFARRLQLITMVVERVHHGEDCGSTDYETWPVFRPPTFDSDGIRTFAGDMAFFKGKFYVDEETQKLKKIMGDETHLYGKPLRFRSSIKCWHKDKHGVCHVCFGDLAKNVPMNANLGHLCTVVLCRQSTQLILSNKHLDASSVAVALILSHMATMFFEPPNGQQTMKMKKIFKDMDVKITVAKDEAKGIVDIVDLDSLSVTNFSRISSIEDIYIYYTDKGRTTRHLVRVAQPTRFAHLSRQFLQHIKKHKYTIDAKGNFVFDLKDWSFSQPIFQFVKREQNYSQHSHDVASVIESRLDELTEREADGSPSVVLKELYDVCVSKLNIHVSCLEVIVYAFMMPEKGNYGMARGAKKPIMGIHSQLMANRSLGAAYVYENLTDVLMDTGSFNQGERPDHPMDVAFNPDKVLEYHLSDENPYRPEFVT